MRILISRFSRLSEIVHPFGDIFRHDYPLEVFLSQPISGVLIFGLCGILQPLEPQLGIVDFWIMREQEFSQLIWCCRVALPCGLLEPVKSFHAVRDQHGTVLVEFSDEVLGVEVAAFGFFYELYCRIMTLCHGCGVILGNHP